MTIQPKTPKPTVAEEKRAYKDATERDNGTCQRCLRDCGPLARDHRQNREAGNTTLANLQCLGLRCHQWKTEHPKEALARGWGVPSYADPRVWPARRWLLSSFGRLREGWVLYRDTPGQDGRLWDEISDEEAARHMGRAA